MASTGDIPATAEKETTEAEESSEEDDYMSMDLEAVLKTHDSRTKSKAVKKTKAKAVTGKRQRQMSRRELEETVREEGLKQAIKEDNVGYKLLQRMGYEPGKGLGRTGEGIVDPIEVRIKKRRECIGRLEAIRAKREAKQQWHAGNQEEFLQGKRQRFLAGRTFSQLVAAMKLAHKLDMDKGIDDNRLVPQECKEHYKHLLSGAAGGLEEEMALEEAPLRMPYGDFVAGLPLEMGAEYLETLVAYLREVHFYCFYCAAAFTDEEDLAGYCPGGAEGDHE